MKRNVLIASHELSPSCRILTGRLRPLLTGCLIDYRFGPELDKLRIRWGYNLSEFGLVILGLSNNNHDKEAHAYHVETPLLGEALNRKVPIGIVCSDNGGITTPALHGERLDRVAVVISQGPNEGCHPHDVYGKATIFKIDDDPKLIAARLVELLPGISARERPVVVSEIPGRSHDQQLTD